jgi:hypothetical protein
VVCVSDEAVLKERLLSSPCLAADSPHELLLMRNCRSAAEGLNRGLALARHPLVVCVHQDVYLPREWPPRFWQQYRQAQDAFGPLGVLGVYGVAQRDGAVAKAGHVVDRGHLLKEGARLPALVDTLDELLPVVPREAPLSFDPRLGFHFYGADLCLEARRKGRAAVAVDAVCFHHSARTGLAEDFQASARAFTGKWAAQLPVATPCVQIDAQGRWTLAR